MNHVMIDLETLGTSQDSAFISIGACYFDPLTSEIGATFYQRIDWHSATADRKHDWETVKWWMRQSDEARLEVIGPGDSLYDTLHKFSAWLPEDPVVWGNGATFDIAILENTYRQHGTAAPWKFWNVRDVRTIVDVASGILSKSDVPLGGTPHHALDDAAYQAKYVSKMWQALRNGR